MIPGLTIGSLRWMVSGWQLTVKSWPWVKRIRGRLSAASKAELKDGMMQERIDLG